MASTSRAATAESKPDVFVNFRGEDTRKSFVSHFSRATEQNGIFAFTDEGLKGGDDISTTLVNKIFESQVAVVVFSPNYADSRWCLDELVHIIQCKQQQGQTVVPVFLQGVKPTDVSHQTGSFGDGFKKAAGEYPDKNDLWIDALKQTADLASGAYDHSYEAEIVDRLISKILSVLGKMVSHDYDSGYFAKHRIEEVKSLLSSHNSIGIWGMGGSGKTTLARKVFDHISNNFEGVCFLENVRDRAEKREYNQLQEQMICQLLGKADRNVSPRTIYDKQTMFRLSRISILIVLDDVSDAGQVKKVIGDWEKYGRGSKMIATSRDMQVLKYMCGDHVYKVRMLDDNDSLQLLQYHMFKQRRPTADQIELLRQTIQYARGLPLSLVVLGRRLYNKNVILWESDLAYLREIPDLGIMKILRSSFDELDDIHKSMFLDIACLLHCSGGDCVEIILKACGISSASVEIILKACGISSASILDHLIDKALITINQYNKLQMHDLLRQMANEISKHSRLWRWKEIADVLSSNMETSRKRKRKIEVISPEISARKKIKLQPDVFKHMGGLRILCLRKGCADNILMPQGLEYLPNKLRYLEWNNYPSPSLPSHIDLENLVELRMQGSNLKELWSGKLCLPNLKCINLCSSKNLSQLPDLSGALKLKELDLSLCTSLTSLPHGIECLANLEKLNLSCCSKLESLPDGIKRLANLKKLKMFGCTNLESLPDGIELLANLKELDLSHCTILTSLPDGFENLANLEKLRLEHCTNLESLPDGIELLSNLEQLFLSHCTNLKSLPDGIVGLANLKDLKFCYCTNLESFPDGIGFLDNLKILSFYSCTNLKSLPDGIGGLDKLEILYLSHCTHLESLPDGIELLSNLRVLDLRHCTNLKSLPDGIVRLANLEELNLSYCTNLESLPDGIAGLANLKYLHLSNCTNMKSLPEGIARFYNQHVLNFIRCTNLERLPEGIGFCENLTTIILISCTKLESLPEGIKYLTHLTKLDLSGCLSLRMIPELPCKLGDLDATNCTSLVKYTRMLSPGPCRGFCFRFLNCTHLEGDAMNHIFEDFILAVSSVLKQSQYNRGADDHDDGNEDEDKDEDDEQDEDEVRNVKLLLPESEFPEGWFNNSSMNTNLRSVADPVVALIFGVVLAIDPNRKSYFNYLLVKCEWRSESGEVLCSNCRDEYGFTSRGGCCTVFWLHLVNPSMLCFPETSFKFSVYGGYEDVPRDDVEILKFGVVPINVDHHVQFNRKLEGLGTI